MIELAYFGGFTHSQIADMLELPAGTVKGRMRLALSKLRVSLAGQWNVTRLEPLSAREAVLTDTPLCCATCRRSTATVLASRSTLSAMCKRSRIKLLVHTLTTCNANVNRPHRPGASDQVAAVRSVGRAWQVAADHPRLLGSARYTSPRRQASRVSPRMAMAMIPEKTRLTLR